MRQQIVKLLNEHPSVAGDAPTAASDPLKLLAAENATLRAVIQELEKGRELPRQFRDNAYWLQPQGTSPEGPYCSTCWDVDRRLVRRLTDALGNLYCEYCTRYRLQS